MAPGAELITAHLPPEQRALIQALDQRTNAMIATMRKAIIEGIRETQLPRPLRAAKAGVTSFTDNTFQLPDEQPDEPIAIPGKLSTANGGSIIFTPPKNAPKRLLGITVSNLNAGTPLVPSRIVIGTSTVMNAGPPATIRIEPEVWTWMSVLSGSAFFQPMGKGRIIREQKPLRAATGTAGTNWVILLWTADLRE